MIYFVRSGNVGPVKIGRTNNIENRLYHLRRDYRVDLSAIRIIDTWLRWPESWLHRHFIDLRIRGEWFTFCDEMMTVELPADPTWNLDLLERDYRPLHNPKRKPNDVHCEEIRSLILNAHFPQF